MSGLYSKVGGCTKLPSLADDDSKLMLKAYNPIANLQRSRSMRDDYDGAIKIAHSVQHLSFGLGVKGGGAFIEQEHGGAGVDRAR